MVAPFIGAALIGGATGALGSLFDRNTARDSQSRQMDFQRELYQHRYQWQMSDMRKAGLNPILSYKQGAPTAGAVGGYTSDMAGGATRGASTALSAKRMIAEINNIEADTALKNEQGIVATTQHQLNDIVARGHVLRNEMIGPEAFSARQLTRILSEGGDTGEAAGLAIRLRQMLLGR